MSIRVFDEESNTESKSNLAMKEISVVVANIDRFGPATNVFLESPAANGIAGFMFSEMHVKEQGLFKLRSNFALQGFHSSVSAASQSELSQAGSCGGTATLFRSYLAISHPFGSIQPGAVGFNHSVERHACDVRFRLPHLQYGYNHGEPSETLRDRCSRQGCRYSLRHRRRLERAAV